MSGAYYNEFDPFAAEWLRELIKAGQIADGEVDERSIVDVRPDDLRGFRQCHFFAGIGGWSHALRLAGWPDDRECWTGSCPCQPFSVAGRGDGFADQRHLWPSWFWLISQCRPSVLFGEQVAAALAWCDVVANDLESVGYAFAAGVIPASAIGASHERQRLWFVADTTGVRQPGQGQRRESGSATSDAFREADQLRDAVQRHAVPYVCGRHDGLPTRVAQGLISGYGNAIVPPVAAEFIESYLECVV